MAEEIRQVDYFYVMVPDKPGRAAAILAGLRDAGVNLVGFSGFPKGRKGQLDFFPSDSDAFAKAAKQLGLSLSKKKSGFLIQGEDQPGTVAAVMSKLASARINVTSLQAVSGGAGRYGAMLWVKGKDMKKAAKQLGVV